MEKLFKIVCIVISVCIVLSSFFMVYSISKSKNDTTKLDFFSCNDIINNIENLEMNMTSIVYVKNNDTEKWEEYKRLHGTENRIWIKLDKMPKSLINAFIAVEDQRFYKHSGVDWKRTGAAFLNWLPFVNILSGNQGGSTLTQQLIKNITSDNDQNASRKFREIIRALAIEKMTSKDTILEAYLNTISLGNGICGVQVASNYYFNKDVDELTLSECACLAGITKNPSAYNPVADIEKNDERRTLVLDLMYEQGYIDMEEYSSAFREKIKLDNTQKTDFEETINDYFVDALIEDLVDDLAEKYNCNKEMASVMLYNGGYKIYATVDTSIQTTMEEVYSNVSKYFSQKRNGEYVQSAMTIMDYSGHIVGIVGGVGKKMVNRGLNRATSAPRQPGSTMKPIGVYAPAIDNGTIYYSSVIEDKPLQNYYKDGKSGPKEWYNYYAGNMTISKAIERSANTIPCHILKDLGIDTSYNFLTKKLNLKYLNDNDKNLAALALGGCTYGITTTESAASYAIFGNGGKYFEPTTYYKVERATGEAVLTADVDGKRAIAEETSTIMNKLLQNVVYGSQGTGRGIRNYSKMKAYAKTGTSSESNDLWMVAGTPYYVGSVWYGFDNNGVVNNGGAAATVWNTVMSKIHKDLPVIEFENLKELETQKYCKYTGKLKGEHCYYCGEGYFVPSHTPEVCDGKHTSLPKDSASAVSSNNVSSTSSVSSTASTIETSSTASSTISETASTESVASVESEPNTSEASLQ